MAKSAPLVVAVVLLLMSPLTVETKAKVATGAVDDVDPLYHAQLARYGPGSLKPYQCPSECRRRSARTQKMKPCLFFRRKCCAVCLCVPPRFYGNKGVCPCYNNW